MRRFGVVPQTAARMPHEVVGVHRAVRARGSPYRDRSPGNCLRLSTSSARQMQDTTQRQRSSQWSGWSTCLKKAGEMPARKARSTAAAWMSSWKHSPRAKTLYCIRPGGLEFYNPTSKPEPTFHCTVRSNSTLRPSRHMIAFQRQRFARAGDVGNNKSLVPLT